MAETRAQQLADALRAIARVNHYMVGLVETVTDEELAEAEQLLIAQQNALPEGKRHRDLGLALDVAENMQRARLQAASRGLDSAYREEADKLRRACELLKAAYDRGAESRGSIDWSDVDVAYLTALSALGEG